MTHTTRVLALGLAAFAVAHLAPAAPSVLRSVRYSALGSTSRLTLWIDGPVRYTAIRQNGQIMLSFPGTRVGSPPGAARILFSTGHVRGVTIDRIGQDSAQVIIALREGTACRFDEPTADGALVLEVSPAGVPPAVLPAARRPSVDRAAAAARMDQPSNAGRSGIVDIPALARTQLEQEHSAPPADSHQGKGTTPATNPVPAVPATTPVTAEAYLALGTVAVLLGGGGLVWAVFRLVRRSRRTPPLIGTPGSAPAFSPAPERAQTSADVRALLEREMSFRRTQSDAEEEDDEDEDEDEEEAIALAKTYGRGKEELNLAFTLQERGRQSSNRNQIERIALGSRTPAAKVRAARKLGTGVGEVELASRLGKMKARTTRRETER